MKRKVLFAIPSLNVGGAERVVTLLLRHLPRERFEPELALVQDSGPFLEQVPADVPVHDLRATRVRYGLPKLLRLVRRLKPDVLLSHLSYLNLAVMLLRPFLPRSTRVLLQETTTLSEQLAEGSRPGLHALAYRLLYARADAVVCCSEAMLEDLVRRFGLPRQRLRCVPNPVDENEIERVTAGSASPYPGGGPHVLGVGRLAREKGYDRLIDAFALLAGRQPDAQLWLLGDGPEREALEQRAGQAGLASRVHFAGYELNPYPWMRHAAVFVQSSRREGLPVAVLEALACGTRVAAFDCPGGTREILQGVEGTTLVPDGNLAALADAMARLPSPGSSPRPVLPARFRLAAAVRAYTELLSGPVSS